MSNRIWIDVVENGFTVQVPKNCGDYNSKTFICESIKDVEKVVTTNLTKLTAE